MRKEGLVVSFLNANANFETKQSIFGTFGSTLLQTSVY